MRLPRLAGLALPILGVAVLCGWLLDVAVLKSVVPGWATMKPITAIAFILLGIALRRFSSSGAGDAVTAGCGLGVVVLVLGQSPAVLAAVPAMGHLERMGPFTAVALVLLGLAVLGLPHRRSVSLAQWAALAGGYLGFLNFVGYAHRLQGLGHLNSPVATYTEMAGHTAAALVLAGAAALTVRPQAGMMAIVLSDGAGGMMSRRLLPAALGLPLVLGWLRLMGERAGLWGVDQGWAVMGLATLTLFGVIVWRSARALHHTDAERQRAAGALRRAHDELERRVQLRTLDLESAIQALEEEVAERRRIEQALRSSEERYRGLIEASRGLICSHDADGTLLMVNPAAAAALGYTTGELVGRNLRELLAPSVRGQFAEYLAQIAKAPIAEAPIAEGLMRVVTRAGEERLWVYTNVRYEEPGRPPHVLGHAHDITELKRVESLAREAAALRSVADLANAAAHEINNPLAIIVGQLEMVRRKSAHEPAIVSRIETAAEAVQRISGIIAKMGSITRLERLPTSPSVPPLLDLHRSGGSGPVS
jgi:PAS domain S-box-containing protein